MSTMGVASGRIAVARFQIQARAIAERDELADVVGADGGGLRRPPGGEPLGGGEAAQAAGGVGVAHRPALGVDAGLGE